jgi:hypothetical protein
MIKNLDHCKYQLSVHTGGFFLENLNCLLQVGIYLIFRLYHTGTYVKANGDTWHDIADLAVEVNEY